MENDGRTYDIIGAAMLIHRELGKGYLEITYQDALAIEFEERRLPFAREVPIEVWFRGRRLGGVYRADFVCYADVIVELKALPSIGRAEVSQLAHYLTATGQPLGILINFGADSLQFQRVIPRKSNLVGPRRTESAELRLATESLEAERARLDSSSSAKSEVPRT